jgi:hypothetical protein
MVNSPLKCVVVRGEACHKPRSTAKARERIFAMKSALTAQVAHPSRFKKSFGSTDSWVIKDAGRQDLP